MAVVLLTVYFLISNYLNLWQGWPGASTLPASWFGDATANAQAWIQGLLYPVLVVVAVIITWRLPHRSLMDDSQLWDATAAYVVRIAFWGVLLVGMVDSLISFLRVEEMLASLVGEELAGNLGRATFRGTYVHYPLLILATVVAALVRTISVSWLALLVVFAEFLIVIARFVFSYEQTFMGDLVRFWYAGLFLFASAYTLREEGHVRVDVLYSHLSHAIQARLNIIGILVLALPLCWIILSLGMWDRTSSLNSPLVSFEISQSGYGLFVKYLMAGFLIVFAVSMMFQFCSYLLRNLAIVLGEYVPEDEEEHHDVQPMFEDKV
ncbi:TRAP transporter small permease subunit [Saccharospirillum salsuginis]|uniref:TRAP transporter small permease protein n=1 Tax=Saccharospirillum salsuginis TaxID=418750 RepID=A0A918N562_9GAMM|nr:TRAP transporter small permease subunit [Saccharospirillum salsuginis]GGX40530.1 hypothetical protein GCM10007392_04100 [Saccharospirillum salsuginis]